MIKLQTPYKTLQGNVYQVANTVRAFKQGELMFILANPTKFARGLNLQECTDMIIYNTTPDLDQMLHRADRYGRTEQLNIYYLVYTSELNKFKETIPKNTQYQKI